MKEYISIGEMSKLLGVSTYNIRYYEKEGLLKSPHKTEKGYRLYSYNDIYRLSTIMLLRDSDIPIKEIKKLLNKLDPVMYKELMIKSSANLAKEIKRLKGIKKQVDGIIQGFDKTKTGYTIKNMKARKAILIKECGYGEELTERELYEFIEKHELKIDDIYKVDLYMILKEKKARYALPYHKRVSGTEMITLEAGDYLSYVFFAEDNDELAYELNNFWSHIEKQNYQIQSNPILNEKSLESLHYSEKEKELYELQIRLSKAP